MNSLEYLAAQIFSSHSIPFDSAERAGGWTNAVWKTEKAVLRTSPTPSPSRILNEIKIAVHLPALVCYPEIIASGMKGDHEWSLAQRIEGINLSEAWPTMNWSQRSDVLTQIWHMTEAIHRVDTGKVEDLVSHSVWYSDFDANASLASLGQLIQREVLTKEQGRILTEILIRFYAALPQAKRVLNHGDITMDNIIWNGKEIAGLLDFEHAALVPEQLDLYSLLRFAFGPESISDIPHAQRTESVSLTSFANSVVTLAQSMLTESTSTHLLLGFAVLISLRRFEIWSASGSMERFAEWEPYRCLVSLADGHGGFLRPVID